MELSWIFSSVPDESLYLKTQCVEFNKTSHLNIQEREHKWFYVLNISQLDEQTNPSSWRKVNWTGGEQIYKQPQNKDYRYTTSIPATADTH